MSQTADHRTEGCDRRVELYVRSLTSNTGADVQERAIERLRGLKSRGAVDSFALRIWGDRVGLSTTAVETDRGQNVLDRIATFRQWASYNDVSLAPFFESSRTTSRITGEEYATIRLPTTLLAEYAGDDVVFVTPHRDSGVVCGVENHLDRLSTPGTDPQLTLAASPNGK